MSMTSATKNQNDSHQKGNVLLVMVIGILVSVTLFLAMFITSQRASSSKQYQNLKIPPIAIPTPPPLPERTITLPVFSPAPVEQNEVATLSSELDFPGDVPTSESSTLVENELEEAL